MKLKKLLQHLQGLTVHGSTELDISGLCAHSKQVAPHNLFIAKKGTTLEGSHFIEEAIAAGAVAILTDLYDPFLKVTQIIHPAVAKIEGQLAAHFYDYPSKHLRMIGVTGTSGKTTSSFLIQHFLESAGIETGLMGGVEWIIKDLRYKAHLTTADVITNHKWLKEMKLAGCKAAVMEVSSHGLEQGRVDEIAFDVALFTNLTPEHLDYHKDMTAYGKAKEKLFTSLKPDQWAVLNADETFQPKTMGNVLSYGIEKEALLRAENITFGKKNTSFTLCYKDKRMECLSPLIGRFNVYNVLGAMGVALSLNIPLEKCIEALASFKQVPGRLERVKNNLGLHIFVDHAHKEEALRNVLITLNEIKKGKLITIFGCGGDRDPYKRPKMGEIATSLSDLTIITSDNPRREDPQEIASQIARGACANKEWIIELDRKRAIQKGIELAAKGDIVLIAGKGHEREQIFGHQIIPFDDVQVARTLCQDICV